MRLHRHKIGDDAVALPIKELFTINVVDPFPDNVVLLYENNKHEKILKMMPACDCWGLLLVGDVAADHPNSVIGEPCSSEDTGDGPESTEAPEDIAGEAGYSRPTAAAPPPEVAGKKHREAPARKPPVTKEAAEGGKQRWQVIGLDE